MATIQTFSRLGIIYSGTSVAAANIASGILFSNSTAAITTGNTVDLYNAAIGTLLTDGVMYGNLPAETLLVQQGVIYTYELRFGGESIFMSTNATDAGAQTGLKAWILKYGSTTPDYSVAEYALTSLRAIYDLVKMINGNTYLQDVSSAPTLNIRKK